MIVSSVGRAWLVASGLVCCGLLDRDGFRDTTVSPHPAQEVMKYDRRTLPHACRRTDLELVPSLANVSMRIYRAIAVTASMYVGRFSYATQWESGLARAELHAG